MKVLRLGWIVGLVALVLSGCEGGEQEKPMVDASPDLAVEVADVGDRAVGESGPESTAASPPPPPDIEPFDQPVTIGLAVKLRSDRRLVVDGTTNLPETTRLQVQVKREVSGVRWQERTEVKDGHFVTGPFGPGSGLPDGGYSITVNLPPMSVQPTAVRNLLGEEGVHLSGPLVGSSPHGLGKVVSITQHFLVGNQPRRTNDSVEVQALEP